MPGNLVTVEGGAGAVIDFNDKRRRVTIGAWSVRALSMSPSASEGDARRAVISIGPARHLLIEARQRASEVWVELWEGQPDESAGLAVAVEHDRLAGIYRIPLCGCGVRECGNIHRQLALTIAAAQVVALIDVVTVLPIISAEPSGVWLGPMGPDGPIV